MNIKMYCTVAALLVAAFSIGRFSAPTSVETSEEERSATHESENVKRDQSVTETTKETRLPDGTIIIEKRKDKETTTQKERNSDSTKETLVSTTTQTRPSYRVGALYEPAIKGFQESNYALIIEKRIVSELYLGVVASSRHTVGITVSLGF